MKGFEKGRIWPAVSPDSVKLDHMPKTLHIPGLLKEALPLYFIK